ncbi:FG-GAP-like repeat-containing protein [Streptomyces sp. UNOB3_S3]|uniref:FG-GAP-like repeat-containing protein n=1 Tax=Streptomyces sp. UNOB3_S3 TaxID=2871682 RepID=UPI001E4B6F30|nr:FG-GAP-like repeat-containing protein [Streptomyces sp. UNOB3_S3]MCC3774101.1 VCBS repeat-containing protein [Streptomyces sp. UNOB3_S3]
MALAYGAFAAMLGTTEAQAAPRDGSSDTSWTRTWGTAMGTAAPAKAPITTDGSPAWASGVSGRQTLRMVVHTSIGGSTTRINLVNTFSKDPVTIGHATIARRSKNGTATGAPVTLTFGGGNRSTVIEPGGSIVSDAAAFAVKADEDLLISIHLPNPVSVAPFHEYTLTTSYISAPGDSADHSAETGGENFPQKYAYWAFLGGVDVTTTNSGGTTVILGDSQTDGGHTTENANRRWSDDYARALQARPGPMGVVNAGISGNALLTDHPLYGQSMVNRFDRDVLAQPNVKSVILYAGVNDIGIGKASASDVIGGIRQLATRAHAAGLSFSVATVPPFKGWGWATSEKEQVRQQVNEYIRTTRDIDSFVDFDRSTRDPLHPDRLFAAYYDHGDDRLHFGDNGSQALSDTVLPAPVPNRVTLRFEQIRTADFTGDNIPDVVARDANSDLYLWAGNKDVDDKSSGDGTFGQPKKLTGDWNFTQTTAADFTGDGKPDLIAKDKSGDLYIWNGEGNGGFSRSRKLTGDWTFFQTNAADFNGDGATDLIATDASGNLSFWKGDNKGGFSRPVKLTDGWNFTQTIAGDFTGDGKADLVAKDNANVLYLWTGDGNGGFSRSRKLTDGWIFSETTALSLRTGGLAHLIGRNDKTGVLNEWLNTGNGEFTRPLRLADGW